LPEKNFFDSTRENLCSLAKLLCPTRPTQYLLVKIPDFEHFISLDRMNIFSFLAAGFCPKNLAFAQKIMVSPSLGGCSPPAPLARTPVPKKAGFH